MSFCRNCGYPLTQGLRYCPQCGNLLHDTKQQTGARPTEKITVPERSRKSPMWVWIIVAAIAVTGAVAVTLILRDSDDTSEVKTNIITNNKEGSDSSAGSGAEVATEAAATSQQTYSQPGTYKLAGTFNMHDQYYPISMTLNVQSNGRVDGKYAYDQTINKYGSGPSSYFYFSGYIDANGNLTFNVKEYNKPDDFEQWEGKLENGQLNGTGHNVITGSAFSFSLY